MNTTQAAPRIHPLMAIAAASVVVVSLVGTAAIAGLLPNSKATSQPLAASMPINGSAPELARYPAAAAQPVAQQYALVPVQAVTDLPAPAPKPIVKKVVHHPRVVEHHYTQVAQNDYDRGYYQPAAQVQPAQPNYVGIGAGALIGGLVGHQVGGGNGKKLATVAGVIGGGMLGNEIANRTQYGR